MSAKNKKSAAPKPTPAPVAPPAVNAPTATAAVDGESFQQRHPKLANAIFAAVCIYVAMLWLLALDQTFHWGIFGPKLPPMP